MIFALFMDRGDSLLLEEYSYPVVTGGGAGCWHEWLWTGLSWA